MIYKLVILIPSNEPDKNLIKLVKNIKKYNLDAVIVNDGSSKEYDNIFNEVNKYYKVISYDINHGKGYALKYGIKYIKDKYHDNYIIITMDSDGQHRIKDAIKLGEYAKNHLDTLVLGKRIRDSHIPLRSKIGNDITSIVYESVSHVSVYDTQTGLRAFSYKLTDFMLSINGDRYEYEMNVLLYAAEENIPIHEEKIKTIYINNNSGSHFNSLKDSFKIYKEIIKFTSSSLLSFLIDYILFIIFNIISKNITLSNIFARMISGTCNYSFNNIVFNKKPNKKTFIQYVLLATTILILNTFILNILISININKYIAKILTEIILFIISFLVQKMVIFKGSDIFVKKDNKSNI